MRPAALVRRSTALTAATALLCGGLSVLAAPAHAANTRITGIDPNRWDNRSTASVVVTGSGFSNADPTGLTADEVRFTPVVPDPTNEVGFFTAPATTPNSSTTALTAEVPLAMAPAGKYHVRVDPFNGSALNTLFNGFEVYGFGPANATGSAFGPTPSGGTSRGARPLDITGSNIAIGAKVRFLRNNAVDSLGFLQGNPNNETNAMGTEDVDGVAGTGYASSTLLQGNYTVPPDTTVNGVPAPGFVPGLRKLLIVNTDGLATGTQSDFAQPWFAPVVNGTSPLSPPGVGKGGENVVVTLTGQGIRAGSTLSISSGATDLPNECAGVTVGPSTVSAPDGNGTFTKISAPVSVASCTTNAARAVSVNGPDGASWSRAGLFTIPANPVFGAIDEDYQTLGQGAHVGFGSEVVIITGTGFVDLNDPGAEVKDPDKMTKFDFGDGVTATTVDVGSGSARVRIDVANDAVVGDRTVTVINPDGGRNTATAGELPPPLGDPAPLTIAAGPKVTKVDPASLKPSAPGKTITVTGTFNADDSYTVKICNPGGPPDCVEAPGITEGAVTDTATALTFSVSTSGAAPGLKDVLVTDTTNKGRFYCVGCIGVDSAGIDPATSSAPNTGTTPVTFTDGDTETDSNFEQQVTANSSVTLTRLVPLAGQGPITGTGLTPGAADSDAITATFDLRGAAPGQYSLTFVKDTTAQSPQSWTCTGCLTVTGAAITTTSIDRVPSDGTVNTATSGGQGASDLVVKIVGTNFAKGMQVSIPDVVVHSVSFALPASGLGTELSFKVDVPAGATPGVKTVTVKNGDGVGPGTGSFTDNLDFEVTAAPAPSAVAAPAPAAYGQGAGSPASQAANTGQTVTITVEGEEFQPNSTLDLGPGITVSNVQVTDNPCPLPLDLLGVCPVDPGPDELTATLAIAETAATGKRDVVVRNADGGTGQVAEAFTVNAGPKIASVANPTGFPVFQPDGVKRTITILGSGFTTGGTPSTLSIVPSTGLTIENVQVVDAGKITADVTAATNATKGARTVGVTNPGDKGFGSKAAHVALKPGAVPGLKLTPLARAIKVEWGTGTNRAIGAADNGAPVTYHLVRRDVATGATTTADVGSATRTITFSNLTNGRKYEISINAVNAAGPGPVAKAQEIAGVKTTLTLVRSRTLATYGTPVDLSGKLTTTSATGVTTNLAGKTLAIKFRPAKGSAILRTAKTTSTGAWSYKGVKLPYNWLVEVSWAGDSTYRPAFAVNPSNGKSLFPAGVFVASRVLRTFPANGSSSSASTTLKISGNVAPNASGRTVYLQRIKDGKWVTTSAKATLSGTSTFVLSYKPGRGTYTFRVYMPKTFDLFGRNLNYQGYSSAFTLKRT